MRRTRCCCCCCWLFLGGAKGAAGTRACGQPRKVQNDLQVKASRRWGLQSVTAQAGFCQPPDGPGSGFFLETPDKSPGCHTLILASCDPARRNQQNLPQGTEIIHFCCFRVENKYNHQNSLRYSPPPGTVSSTLQ